MAYARERKYSLGDFFSCLMSNFGRLLLANVLFTGNPGALAGILKNEEAYAPVLPDLGKVLHCGYDSDGADFQELAGGSVPDRQSRMNPRINPYYDHFFSGSKKYNNPEVTKMVAATWRVCHLAQINE